MAAAGLLIPQATRPSSPTTSTTTSGPHPYRQSYSSSATSYKTAPQTGSHSSLALSTSSHTTINAAPRDVEHSPQMYGLTAREVHVVKLTTDGVRVDSEPVPDGFLNGTTTRPFGVEAHGTARLSKPENETPTAPPSPVLGSDHEQLRPSVSMATVRQTPAETPLSVDTATPPQTLFAAAKLSSSPSEVAPPSKTTNHLSIDGFLQLPPTSSVHPPARRNTTGSSPTTSKRPSPHAKGASTSLAYDDAMLQHVEGSIELATDIERHAEQIRRERMSKRAKQEAEAALTYGEGSSSGPHAHVQDQPLVGNLIGEDHVNYVLMYNMLTGIRIAVSRCGAKIKRPVTDEDFTARHKYSFDIVGNELTPSAKYDFKFKDYAPWVFRELREDIFHIDPADYLLSLTAKYILSELGSPGKSGSFFYFSRDYRFIIKTIHHSEHKYLLKILKRYHSHVSENPDTLISRFYGLHRVKLPRGRKIHFVIMNNLFPPHKDIHVTFDLKGSTVGREYPEDKAQKNPRAVLKDINWINRGMVLELGPTKEALFMEQLRRDAEFLKSVYVMDYSLLVGIHNMQRGNRDKVRKNTLKVFSPNLPETRRSKAIAQSTGAKSPEAIAMRRAMRSSDPKRLGKHTMLLPDSDAGVHQDFAFYQDEGGMRATDENNDPLDMIYYLGVIDILTPYSFFKKAEHVWKGLQADIHKISPVPPAEYADRFYSFMKAIMKGGEGAEAFKPKAE